MAVDATGQISVELPDGWRAATRTVGRGRRTPGDSADRRWWCHRIRLAGRSTRTVPGAFIWLFAEDGATTTSPSAFIAGRPHAGCVAAPVRTDRQAGLDWLIAGYRDCPNGRAQIVEAVGTRPGDTGLVYVQIAPPAGSPPAFVDTLLAGVRVR